MFASGDLPISASPLGAVALYLPELLFGNQHKLNFAYKKDWPQTPVKHFASFSSNSRFLTCACSPAQLQRHWRRTSASEPGCLVVNAVSCPNCSLRSSGPPIGFSGRIVWHLLGSMSFLLRSRSMPSCAGCLVAAFPRPRLRACLSLVSHLVLMQHWVAVRSLCPVPRPKISLILQSQTAVPYRDPRFRPPRSRQIACVLLVLA